jgi:hypothetical protein
VVQPHTKLQAVPQRGVTHTAQHSLQQPGAAGTAGAAVSMRAAAAVTRAQPARQVWGNAAGSCCVNNSSLHAMQKLQAV